MMIRYASDRHKCVSELNTSLAGKSFHPDTNTFAASGVRPGPQEYSISG
ncbi:MAG: hypothetical protein WA192_09565 [Candidatus Acidiferrales bacterium]